MPLSNEQFDGLMREYEKTRNINRRLTEEKIDTIEKKLPSLREYDNKIATLSIQQAKSIMDGKNRQAEDIADEIAMMRVRRRSELESIGFKEEDLEPIYTCVDCRDTGFINRLTGNKEKCHCLKKRELEILYNQSKIKDLLKKENFSKLSYEYCTGEDLTTLQTAVRICKEFINDFDVNYTNLVLYGEVGTGKSFLSCCIAHELIESGRSVLYMSAPQLFETLAQYQFGNEREGRSEFMKDLQECDLLIIDDLGTELSNAFVASSLFTVISERHNRNHPTIINTNLSLIDIRDRYSDRTLSRVTGNYKFVQLSGPDVRQLL